MSYLEIKNYSKTIKGNEVLKNINLELESGHVYSFYGRNGCGKSMLFKAICGFIYPTQGEIIIDGKKLHQDMDVPQSVGALIENSGFIHHLTGFENLKLLADINHQIGDEVITSFLDLLHLNNDKLYKQYSLGMKQRLAIAQAMMENPTLIILDEPMNALDQEHVEIVKELILQKRNAGALILLASHNKEDLKDLSDTIYEMENGEIKGLIKL